MSHALYFGQIVIGPAGSGKYLQEHAEVFGRNFLVINLDPAAEAFNYRCDIDIRDLITLDDVKEELELGPNGGLVYCLEYLLDNIDWLMEQLGELNQEDYVIFDCPGQIELYAHLDIMTRLVNNLTNIGFAMVSVYIIDSTFIVDEFKFISGALVYKKFFFGINLRTLASMINLGLPHMTILSKCDLVQDKKQLKKYTKHYDDLDIASSAEKSKFSEKYLDLTIRVKKSIDEFNLLAFMPMDITDDESIRDIIYQADTILQYDEHVGPRDRYYDRIDEGNGGLDEEF